MKTDQKTAECIIKKLRHAEDMRTEMENRRKPTDKQNEALHYWDGKITAYRDVCQYLHIEYHKGDKPCLISI